MLKNNSLKVLSVIIAILLWAIVVSGQTETISLTVPVRLIKTPGDYVAVSDTPSVSVVVKGPARIITNLDYTSIVLNIDVSKIPVGNSQRRILASDFQSPIGVDTTEVTPQTINITLDRVASKQVKVIPTFIGDVAKGFKVESAIASPGVVVVEGAKSKLKNINSISTTPINISNISDNTTFTIGFKEVDGVKTITPSQIVVSIKMRQVISRKIFKDVPVVCQDLRNDLRLKEQPMLSSVSVIGREDFLDNFINATNFIVNCSSITKPGTYNGEIAYNTTLTKVVVERMSPKKINFEIIKK